ncbi:MULTISPECIES: D-arabinono-1,4-lactone oxidase [Kocuria]|jgi:FAD-linked oxidoreductase|uniref:FAD-linked oxidase n=1 Tax=Kocuria rosea subsp. polaris TaxID=136273 RepID=A0A0A6VTH1_KOCRO|nr:MULTISPECIES: D-arabinono-1,4-lactone oxidase [Kocuria]EYT52366.1 FAD-linked oxidoreductase [Kocuria sp. UCD-OTCP]KHD97926.1 FAD-linked oxidase [Kocuria polaris]MEB2525748.1 D-arabinono-1,4-lactone oxidase [Kocuria rosea]MEB2618554.1 D-arabinono-1,4-lactone oxidase [Kocuria rosea]NVC22783.1 FAD-binding protein [Kocuria salina]
MSEVSLPDALPGETGTREWATWGRTHSVTPRHVLRPTSVPELAEGVAAAVRRGLGVRAVGSGCSFSALPLAPDVMVDLSGLSGLPAVDRENQRVTVLAGTTIRDLNQELDAHGLAVTNLPDSDWQTVAGAVSTGTHGTGLAFGSLSQQVVALSLVTADGELVECSAEQRPELFQAARVGLGAMGVLASVTLVCEPTFRLHAAELKEPLGQLVDTLGSRMAGADHFEFFWTPGTATAQTRILTRLHKLPDSYTRPGSPVARTVRRLDDALLRNTLTAGLNQLATALPRSTPGLNRLDALTNSPRQYSDLSFRVFTVPRRTRFVSSEYALPVEELVVAFRELQTLIERRDYSFSLPVDVRCAAAEDAWLAPAHGRETGWIALRQYWRRYDPKVFAAAEEIFVAHGGRPHWGTVHTQDAEYLRSVYPRFQDFLDARASVDPDGVFLNDHVRGLLGL